MGSVLEVIGLFLIGTIAAHYLISLATQAVMRRGSDLAESRPSCVNGTPQDFDDEHPGRERLGL